jgi:hypothetical protein
LHLALIETAGNQAFIFATNKLRENVGASELTYRTGTQLVLEVVAGVGGPALWDEDSSALCRALLDRTRNLPLERNESAVEVVLAVSGKALLLTRDRDTARDIIQRVTTRALKEAPGLDVRGALSGEFDLAGRPIHDAVGEVHRNLEESRSHAPGPALRFLRLPVVAECATSGLPAARYDASLGAQAEHGPRSAVALGKQEATQRGLDRMLAVVKRHGIKVPLPRSTTELEDLGCDWLAVVHADGNGLGGVFLQFDQHAEGDNRAYLDQLRRFSLALDGCTEAAFCKALANLERYARREKRGREYLPVVPLVLGGDDLTVVCDGRRAARFACDFLRAFEDETARDDVIPQVMGKAGRQNVSSCAGVAIVKPHFPFHAAYGLAEELLRSAKGRKPHSAVDFHVLYDASGPDLERIRRKLLVDGAQTQLFARPYVVTRGVAADGRHLDDLARRLNAVRYRDEEGRRLPGSMLHELREGLFLGHEAADARMRLVRRRYQRPEGPDIDDLLGNTADAGTLFWQEDGRRLTGLLDAMELAEFWDEETPA